MHKHIEDDGDLALLINSDGEVLLVCSHCKRTWLGKFTSFKTATKVDRDSALASLQAAPPILEALDIDMQAFG